MLVTVLGSKKFEFVVQTGDDVLLTTQLSLIVSLESSATDVESFFTFSQLLDLGLEGNEISLAVLMSLDFSSVSANDSN